MVVSEQRSIGSEVFAPQSVGDLLERETGERAARETLRGQVARLERELSQIVVVGFPHIPAMGSPVAVGGQTASPRLLTLGELERQRDALVERVREMRQRTAGRAEFEQRARAQLQRMRLEPGRYKFTRLRVADLGEGGCGVWEVRPRLGLIGMLAGWWQLKLSSGCPLARGPRFGAAPPLQRVAHGPASRSEPRVVPRSDQRLNAIAPSRGEEGASADGCALSPGAGCVRLSSSAASVRR